MASKAMGVKLNHIARESSNVKRLAAFYQEVLGFERIESPNFGDFEVIWLRLSPDVTLHLIERHPESKPPEGPHVPSVLPRSHHVCFGVSNYDDFVESLKVRGIEIFEKRQPDGKTRQVFFYDPDDPPADAWFQGLLRNGLCPDWNTFKYAIHDRFSDTDYEDPLGNGLEVGSWGN